MKVLHISAECYPAAKVGGMGDVVGALPKYLNQLGCKTGVVIPKYRLQWIDAHHFEPVYRGAVRIHQHAVPFSIQQLRSDELDFPFFVADIPGKFDRPGIYADLEGRPYEDEVSRNLCFQQAVLQWIANTPGKPGVLHCHDHHTGLIPFMAKHCPEYQSLKDTPTVFTIHNGVYAGAYSWRNMYLLPFFEAEARGLLDWQNAINPLAAAVKCAWRVTTVSPSYLQELQQDANGLESLLQHEQHKCLGIINGIDTQVWDPATDPFLPQQLGSELAVFKAENKQAVARRFHIDERLPLITFIGRLVEEKGADLLPDLIDRVIRAGINASFVVLGTGQQHLHHAFQHLAYNFPGRFDTALEYNEGLAHQLYAGSDFLIMPSRVEPCGLNQMYAMRYGTLPIVRSVGGLKDTVPDVGEPNDTGRGIRFDQFNLDDGHLAIYRAVELYEARSVFEPVRQRITEVDFSWERSAKAYRSIYDEMAR